MASINLKAGQLAFRELWAQVNKVQTDIAALRTSYHNHTHGGVEAGAATTAATAFTSSAIAALTHTHNRPRRLRLNEIASKLTSLYADVAQFASLYHQHVHGGITAGAGTSAAGPSLPALISYQLPNPARIRNLIELADAVNRCVADLKALTLAMDAHTHGGITAGAANTAAGPNKPAQTSDEVKLVA